MIALYKDPEGDWVFKSSTAGTATDITDGTVHVEVDNKDSEIIQQLLEKIKMLEDQLLLYKVISSTCTTSYFNAKLLSINQPIMITGRK